MNIPTLPIIYQDSDLIAINKPSGLLVHRSALDKYETQFAVQTLRDQIGQHVYPIHRLDKPTSGVLLFAFTPEIVQRVSQYWHNVDKRYFAIVRGKLNSQCLNHPIRTLSEMSKSFRSSKTQQEKIQSGETEFQCLAYSQLPISFGKRAHDFPYTTFSLVEARPKTGRKHQIRKHLKHLNHPIVGDTRYGRGEINRYFRQYGIQRLLLHCHYLGLQHPATGENLHIHAPLDSTWQRFLMGKNWRF